MLLEAYYLLHGLLGLQIFLSHIVLKSLLATLNLSKLSFKILQLTRQASLFHLKPNNALLLLPKARFDFIELFTNTVLFFAQSLLELLALISKHFCEALILNLNKMRSYY